MNRLLFLLAFATLTACGYSHRDNELVGQPKAVEFATPIFCPDQHILHLSLGVMRHGVGSMSTEDVMINIPDDKLVPILESVVKQGKLISAQTNEARFRVCNEEKELVAFEIIDDDPADAGAPPSKE